MSKRGSTGVVPPRYVYSVLCAGESGCGVEFETLVVITHYYTSILYSTSILLYSEVQGPFVKRAPYKYGVDALVPYGLTCKKFSGHPGVTVEACCCEYVSTALEKKIHLVPNANTPNTVID